MTPEKKDRVRKRDLADEISEYEVGPTKRRVVDWQAPVANHALGFQTVDPTETQRLRTKVQQLERRMDEVIRECTMLKLEARTPIGRAPTAEEFDQLNYHTQKWWAEKYPELERFRQSPSGVWPCGWRFAEGVEC